VLRVAQSLMTAPIVTGNGFGSGSSNGSDERIVPVVPVLPARRGS